MLTLRQRATYAESAVRYAAAEPARVGRASGRALRGHDRDHRAGRRELDRGRGQLRSCTWPDAVLHRVPMQRLEQHLDPAQFLRVHRSAIVRIDQ